MAASAFLQKRMKGLQKDERRHLAFGRSWWYSCFPLGFLRESLRFDVTGGCIISAAAAIAIRLAALKLWKIYNLIFRKFFNQIWKVHHGVFRSLG